MSDLGMSALTRNSTPQARATHTRAWQHDNTGNKHNVLLLLVRQHLLGTVAIRVLLLPLAAFLCPLCRALTVNFTLVTACTRSESIHTNTTKTQCTATREHHAKS